MSADELTTVGARLRWAREYAGLSRGQVSLLLELDARAIDSWEDGSAAVSGEEIERFSELYEIEAAYLRDGQEREAPDVEAALARSKVSAADRAEVLAFARRIRVRRG